MKYTSGYSKSSVTSDKSVSPCVLTLSPGGTQQGSDCCTKAVVAQ